MHRWFFAGDEIIYKAPTPPATPGPEPCTPPSDQIPEAEWKFTVKFKGRLCSNESVALTGNCDSLGNWEVQKCVILQKIPNSSAWTITLNIPRNCDIRYRYLICATNDRGYRIVRSWETHKGGRLIRQEDEQELEESMSSDVFGVSKGARHIERGWISGDVQAVQFTFFQAPFTFKEVRSKNPLLLYVKVTLMKLKSSESSEVPLKQSQNREEEKDEALRKTFAYCEVASWGQSREAEFHCQPKYGTACHPEEILMFHMTLGDVANTVYLIDLYTYPPKTACDVPPYHLGYQYVLPQQLKGSEGTLRMNIMCATKHRSIGSMVFDYLLIKPLSSHTFDLRDTSAYDWRKEQIPLHIGHRGCGKSFWFQDKILRENTLNSFIQAMEHGADMVEFDVLLTYDRIPIIYHDLQLYISRKAGLNKTQYDVMELFLDKDEINELKRYARVLKSGFISLPVNKFTLQQLKSVQAHENPPESPYSLPFVTLEKVLKNLPSTLGFNIEIKWPENITESSGDFHPPDIDKNEYVDIILNTVLTRAGSRCIIFSSSNANICSMVRLKQNQYPVLFLCNTNDPKAKLLDPRGDSLLRAAYFAQTMELFGIAANARDILDSSSEISYIRERNIRLFAWGSETRLEECRKSLKDIGVDGIIYDRMNHFLTVDDLKQNVFLINERSKEKSVESKCLRNAIIDNQ